MKRLAILVMVLTLGIFNTSALEATPWSYEMQGVVDLDFGTDILGIDGETATLLAIAGDAPNLTGGLPGEFSSAYFPLTELTLTIGSDPYNTTSASPWIGLYNSLNTSYSDQDFIQIRAYFSIPDASNTPQLIDLQATVDYNSLNFWTSSEVPPTHKTFDGSVVDSIEVIFGDEIDEGSYQYIFVQSEASGAAVPEPATMLLLGTGLLGLGVFGRKKFRK